MKQIKVVLVGYGNRGQIYCDYALSNPNEMQVVAVVEPNPFRLQEAKERYSLSVMQVFASFADFLATKIECDFVINATMDEIHFQMAMEILEAKYDMLIEKPVVPNEEQLNQIVSMAAKNDCRVFVCHVLRYTPFYLHIKEALLSGGIGKIISMEMNEHVGILHYLSSYNRGKWNTEKKCGSGFLLAKCCHDLDLICWLNNETRPQSVFSFGGRKLFVAENKPEGSTDFCYRCPYKQDCRYSALKVHYEWNVMPFLTWAELNKPLNELTKEEKLEYLKHSVYGRCAYETGGDIVDRQNLTIQFENGSLATFTLVGGCTRGERYIHIVGEKGEIEGKVSENKFILRTLTGELEPYYKEEIIDVSKEIGEIVQDGGHFGGDRAIMRELIRYYNGDRSSLSITSLSDSVNGHLCVYAAEKSRKSGLLVKI